MKDIAQIEAPVNPESSTDAKIEKDELVSLGGGADSESAEGAKLDLGRGRGENTPLSARRSGVLRMVDHDLARHEAGHATVAAALGIPVLYIQISREPVGAVIDHPTDANEVKREDLDARFAGEALTPLEYSEAGLALIADEVTVYLGGLAGESVSQTPAAFSATRAADDLAKVFRLIAKYTEHLPEDDRDARVRDYFQERQGAAWNLIVTHCKTHFILADVMVNGHDLSKNEITDMIRNMGEMPVPK